MRLHTAASCCTLSLLLMMLLTPLPGSLLFILHTCGVPKQAASGYSASSSSRGSSSSSSSGYGSMADWFAAAWVDLGDESDSGGEEAEWGSDSDEELDAEFEEAFMHWAASGSNFKSSFTSSWEVGWCGIRILAAF